MTAPTVGHWDVGEKYATGVPNIKKIRGRENISIRTWNVRTLRPAGKLKELTHEMNRYHWNILGLCEMRRKTLMRCQQMLAQRFTSVEKRTGTSMGLIF
ncbi:MAG: hypothetical protein AB2693_23320 [Candidatus Thiodiazotropha sp.]